MYTPKAFQLQDRSAVLDIVEREPFALLVTSDDEGLPVATHLPFGYDAEEGERGTLVAHMAKANPHWKLFRPGRKSLVVFAGAHGYISPRYYASEKNVPTWSYVAVHMTGEAELLDDETARRHQKDLVNRFEAGREDPWGVDDMDPALFDSMLRAIVAFRIPVDSIEAKAKLSQNKSDEDRRAVMQALSQSDNSWDKDLLAAMQNYAGL